jgi:outer membrane protein TolC
MRAEVEVANFKPGVIAAKNTFQASLTVLRNILALPKNTEIELQGQLEYAGDEFQDTNLDELRQLAFEHRPELFTMEAQKKIAAKSVTISRSQFLPKLFFTTNYSFLAMRNDYDFRSDDLSKGFTSAISLQMPLFTGFKNAKQYQKAKIDYKIMDDTEQLLHDGIVAGIELAFNKYKESEEKYFAASESIDLAEEALRLANLMYEEGASTQLDVLSSQLALIRSRLNYATALYEYQMARYALRKVTGTLAGIL